MIPFTLIAVGIILIALNLNAVLKEKKSFKGQLDSRKDKMEDYRIEIGKMRKEFAETVFELQEEIKNLKDENKNSADKMILYDSSGSKKTGTAKRAESKKTGAEAETEKNDIKDVNNVKVDEVKNLLGKNVSIDEISKKTGIGKGEVLLIKELYIK
ncbi:MAG TPA: hypothetical protein DC034_03800 [Clostridium sp.]|jgi:uncharacterized membrane-anchored protein YhcB (DUF1043 family)|nr:hypothetical protein [Clostridiales bacterium]HBC95906.1 hypothetical protein [Clostridium sp.]